MERGDTEQDGDSLQSKELEQEDLFILFDKQVHKNGHGQLMARRTSGWQGVNEKDQRQSASLQAVAAPPASIASRPEAHILKKAVERPQRVWNMSTITLSRLQETHGRLRLQSCCDCDAPLTAREAILGVKRLFSSAEGKALQ